MTQEEQLQALFDDRRIVYFVAREFLVLGASHHRPSGSPGSGLNSPPPDEWLPRLADLAWVWNRIRDELGYPISVISAWRAPAYNRAIGGASRSQHMQARAADCVSRAAAPRTIFNIARGLRHKGIFSGGIGVYPGFVHVDIRGRNATWQND